MNLIYAFVLLLFQSFSQTLVHADCPPITGTFSISQSQVFPETADWDTVHCRLYVGVLYNASLLIYNPYDKSSEIITLPGISGTFEYHVSGIDYDRKSGSIFIAANSASSTLANSTGLTGQNLTGPNSIIRYNTNTGEIVFEADLAPVEVQVLAATGQRTNLFQDMAEDSYGNSYTIGSFGDVLTKIDPSGDVSLYYQPTDFIDASTGFGGIFSLNNKLIISDTKTQGFVTFDTTTDPATPVYVKPENFPANYTAYADGLYAPPKYGGQIALWSDDFVNGIGAIVIYGSIDGWQTASYLGLIPNNNSLAVGSTPTATVEITGSLYIVEEFFKAPNATSPGDRSTFPFVDITEQVDKFVAGWIPA